MSERSEQAVTNAIQRVMRAEARHLRFLTGHGERNPNGRGRSALARFVRAVEDTGVKVSTLNLAKTPEIPDDTAALVIASPTQPLLDAEVGTIRKYVERGGHLLWLTDGGPNPALKPVADKLGLSFPDGRVVDPRSQVFGLQDPTRVLVSSYGRHPITRDFQSITLFPGATGLTAEPPKAWQSTPFLKTGQRAWVETGEVRGKVRFNADDGDRKGPVNLGVALKRTTGENNGKSSKPGGQAHKTPGGGPAKPGNNGQNPSQRVVVTADSDFLSNAFLGSGANRDLGLNMVHWLTADQAFINVQPDKAPGTSLQLPTAVAWALPVLFLGGIPLLLLAAGTAIWLRRRRL
ncbi:MAG: GldG family protein [Thiohalorhabdaceae bacterium]